MKVLVCFKVVPDLEKVVDEDWAAFHPAMDLRYAVPAINCFDESALEWALRLREQLPEEHVECTALTLGEPPPVALCQTLYAVGFDHVQVLAIQGAEFCPAYVAETLAVQVKQGGYDLVLLGRQAGFADTASVPFYLAERCGYPVVGQAEAMSSFEGGIAVNRRTEGGLECLYVRLPAVVAVGNSPVAVLRAATLRNRLAAAKQPVEHLTATSLPPRQTAKLIYEPPRGVCTFWKEENPTEIAQKIIEQYWKEAGWECAL